MERAANWLLSVRVHVRNLRTHFPLNDVTGSEFIALRMRKCAQSASVSSQTSSKKKIRPDRRLYGPVYAQCEKNSALQLM